MIEIRITCPDGELTESESWPHFMDLAGWLVDHGQRHISFYREQRVDEHNTKYIKAWRFQVEDHLAVLFKLTWGGK